MRRRAATLVTLLLAVATATPSVAQNSSGGLRGKISQLFIFGSAEDPLFLAGSADPTNPASVRAHGSHFVPAAVSENASLIGFLTDAISFNVANVPIGTTSGGVTFRFEAGAPVKTSTSAGPIFAERAQTLGKGRTLIGVNRSSFHFTTLRGVPLDDIKLFFTHQNVDFAGCDSTAGGDCTLMGIPNLENDIMQFDLDLSVDVQVSALYATYGVTDWLDLSIVLPFVSTKLHGESLAQIIPFGGPTAAHFFAGTTTSPGLSASREVDGSAFGLGDVAARAKVSIHQTQRSSVALLAQTRFATGTEQDLLGSGSFAARGLAIVSGTVGAFSPHLNLGYLYRSGKEQSDAVLATAGFDNLIAEHVTLAADVVSELQVGQSNLRIPPPVQYDFPFKRTVTPTSIPDQRDDIVTGSFGFKITTNNGFTIVTNALVPLNRGGLRSDVTFTGGLEFAF